MGGSWKWQVQLCGWAGGKRGVLRGEDFRRVAGDKEREILYFYIRDPNKVNSSLTNFS